MRAAFLAVTLLLASPPLYSENLLLESVFLPPRFFVGDRVELRLKYDVPAGVAVQVPDRLPEHAWIEFLDIDIQDRRISSGAGVVQVRLHFIPFSPGEAVLPSIRLGDLDTGELMVSTQSTLELEPDPTLRGPRRQLLLPLTWLRLLVLLLIAAGTPLCLYLLLRYGIRSVARIREARLRRLPYIHARKGLSQLETGRSSMEGKSFFILLSLTIRRYLSERYAVPLMSVTTGEILKELNIVGVEESVSRRIHEILKTADIIKFSGKRTRKREMERCLKAAGRIVEQVEERVSDVGI
jgi:hypothetical protein